MTGQIVIVSGTSGAGKTTTSQAFAKRSHRYLMLGMDLLVGMMMPGKYSIFGAERKDGYYGTGFGDMGFKAVQAMHEMIAAAARSGQNMMVDHLMFVDPPILQDCIWRLRDVPVTFVNLRPSKETLERRLKDRKMDNMPPQMAELISDGNSAKAIADMLTDMIPWYYEHAYQNDCFDLEVDSSALSPDQVVDRIEARMKQGPGTAFEKLRQRYPKPAGM